MARKPQEDHGTDKGKLRLIYAEIEGNNQSLQDALKTMVAAMNRPVHLINGASRAAGNSRHALAGQTEEAGSDNEVVESEAADEVALTESDETSPAPARKRGLGPKQDRNAGIKLVPDIDFVPDGKQSLKSFFAEKAPSNDMENVLVVAYYMQHTLALHAIGPGHILTAFKHVVKSVPVDLRATIRNMKSQKVWLNFTDLEAIRVTTQGDNYVDHELGAEQKA
jgi:hypothetical protein